MPYRIGEWKTNCKKCGRERIFNVDSNLYRFRRKGSICNSCARLGQTRTENQKAHIATKTKEAMNRPEIKQKLILAMNTDEVKKKLRENFAKQIKATGTNVPYNPLACEYFDWLNKWLGWEGQYATNGGEKCVAGFWVDYYEPTHNIVIEWDEPHHEQPCRKKKDIIRQRVIMKELKCSMFRIEQQSLEIHEVTV